MSPHLSCSGKQLPTYLIPHRQKHKLIYSLDESDSDYELQLRIHSDRKQIYDNMKYENFLWYMYFLKNLTIDFLIKMNCQI